MGRNARLFVGMLSIAAAGCIEYTPTNDIPEYPDSIVPPVDNVHQQDRIVQVTTPTVDVLWTIDNSGSMGNEQDELAQNFPLFIDYFIGSGLDYHIGVVSTDIDRASGNGNDGNLRTIAGQKFIDPDTLQPDILFASMAQMGTNGSGTEKGLGASYKALEMKRDTYNAGFYRDEASVHTVIISDERDQTPGSLITQPEYVDWYDSLKDDNDDRTFSCVVTMSGPDRGTAYLNTTSAIGGISWDITDEDWSEVLERLGIQASGLNWEYFLSQCLVFGMIEVRVMDVGGAELAFDETTLDAYGNPVATGEGSYYVYDRVRNSVTFLTYIPNALSTVLIDYTLLSAQQVEDVF
jgi:hypothetical protein